MANDDHIARLMKGVDAWNAWREENRNIRPDLSEANLFRADLARANLEGANLEGANLEEANLREAYLSDANLQSVNLAAANLEEANLGGADLSLANLREANLRRANLAAANLRRADLSDSSLEHTILEQADLSEANLAKANLSEANLRKARILWANLSKANLSNVFMPGADIASANLTGALLCGGLLNGTVLVDTDLTGADLTGCRVCGVSTWNLKMEWAKQQNLVITADNEPTITIDNVEVAQFIYLLLHNQKIRDVIDTFTSKAVLILGRFTDERKAVLDALRQELRERDYLPILFDFDAPATRDITETISLLARMARFIIADLTDPTSIPKELEAIIPDLAVPVQPLLEGSSWPYAMFKDYEWVLPVYRYEGLEPLLATLAENVIAPAEEKVKALQERRRMIEAELTKPQ
jgi:uncharacterized protein YjbI with pentapeptide repeats